MLSDSHMGRDWKKDTAKTRHHISLEFLREHDAKLSCFGSVSSSHGQEAPSPCQDTGERPADSFIHPSLAMFGVVARDELPFPRQTGPKVG